MSELLYHHRVQTEVNFWDRLGLLPYSQLMIKVVPGHLRVKMSWVQGSPLGGRGPACLPSSCVGEKMGGVEEAGVTWLCSCWSWGHISNMRRMN